MTDLAQFAGRFHPLLVHFPIALLVVAALLRVIEHRLERVGERGGTPSRWSRLVLGVGAVTSVASASTGWLLGASGGYGGDVFDRHQALGIVVAVIAMLALGAACLPGRRWRLAESLLLAAAVVAVVPAGHYGATLTHGEGFLTEYAPPVVRRLVRASSGAGGSARLAGRPPDQLLVFADLVAPVLQTHCVTCHGPSKTEGGLRLDTVEGLTKGGDDGPVITAGRAASSDLVRRLYLPASHDDAMPPKGHRPLSPADAALVRWWVDSGAAFDLTLADAQIVPEVLPAIEALAGPIQRGGPTVPAVPVADAPADAVDAALAQGFSVVRVAAGRPFLHVHCTNAAARITDASVGALARLAPQILWLDLGGSRISDRAMADVARLPNLSRLHLQHTQVGDAGVAQLRSVAGLEYLNLYETPVTDEGIQALSSLKRLRALYVWGTRVTPAGTSRLQAALPRLVIEAGVRAAGPIGAERQPAR